MGKRLHHSDILYQNTRNVLKIEGKFINELLRLDEIPEIFAVTKVHYLDEKEPTVSEVPVDITEEYSHLIVPCTVTSACLSLLELFVLLLLRKVAQTCHGLNGL